MILPDDRSVLALDTFVRHTRTHHFRQSVDVDCVDTKGGFDLASHLLGPRFGTKDSELERARRRVQALRHHRLGDGKRVRRCDHNDVGPEVVDQLNLFVGLPTRHRHHGASEPLGSVMSAQPACE